MQNNPSFIESVSSAFYVLIAFGLIFIGNARVKDKGSLLLTMGILLAIFGILIMLYKGFIKRQILITGRGFKWLATGIKATIVCLIYIAIYVGLLAFVISK